MRIFVMEGCDEHEAWQTDADDALIKRYCKVNVRALITICEGQQYGYVPTLTSHDMKKNLAMHKRRRRHPDRCARSRSSLSMSSADALLKEFYGPSILESLMQEVPFSFREMSARANH